MPKNFQLATVLVLNGLCNIGSVFWQKGGNEHISGPFKVHIQCSMTCMAFGKGAPFLSQAHLSASHTLPSNLILRPDPFWYKPPDLDAIETDMEKENEDA